MYNIFFIELQNRGICLSHGKKLHTHLQVEALAARDGETIISVVRLHGKEDRRDDC